MTHTYDYSVSPSALLDALANLDYLAARSKRFGGVGAPTTEHADDSVAITAVRQLPMDKIPVAIKGLVGDGQITQVDTWSSLPDAAGTLLGTWRADLGTAPANISGDYSIEATSDGSSYSCTVNVKVKVPFVGGKIEQQVRSYLDDLITKEQDFLDDWLGKR
ncbi:MAG: DUF2505 domain-containing protein [Actinomycetia bacterium]|nr:DUF2505 domain-containing protein [Actinomycetes bacterium]